MHRHRAASIGNCANHLGHQASLPPKTLKGMAFLHHAFTFSGEGEIRTPADIAARPVFETGAFNHSATSPGDLKGKLHHPDQDVKTAGFMHGKLMILGGK